MEKKEKNWSKLIKNANKKDKLRYLDASLGRFYKKLTCVLSGAILINVTDWLTEWSNL